MTKKANAAVTAKPFRTGSPTDESTLIRALKFFGSLLLVAFMTFIICSMTSFSSAILRIGVNCLIEVMILIIFYYKGIDYGTEGVAKGEILYQHIQKGIEVTEGEKRVPFNRCKGFVIGFSGSLLIFILAVILAVTAERSMTGAGVLPSWTESYLRRTEIGGALVSYANADPINVTDILRIIIRLTMMPFISMAGSENRDLLLTIERFSPLIALLPAIAYGAGYLQGPARRKLIHTEIAQNRKKRIRKEKRERKARSSVSKGPQQLN